MNKKENLLDVIKGLFLERSSNFYHENGEIHPIYEAVAALLIKSLDDEEAINRLLNPNGESLKSVLITDGILGRLKEDYQRGQLRQMLSSGNSLDNIIEQGALYLSENKRVCDGDILYRTDELPRRRRKDLLKRIKKIIKDEPRYIYIKKDLSDYLERNAKKFRRNRIIKYSIIWGITLSTLMGGCFLNKYDNKTETQQETNITTPIIK